MAKSKKTPPPAPPQIRDRVKELRRVRAGDITPNPKNWRTHPQSQQDALRGVLAEVGYADALLARELPGGSLMLIDGHLRAETTPDVIVPVLILDVNESEADKILATLDPLAAMADADGAKLDALLREVNTSSEALQGMLDDLANDAGILPPEVKPGAGGDEFDAKPEEGPTRAKAGDLWVIGGVHRLLVGDCTVKENVERLMGGAKAGLCFTSPPYNVGSRQHLTNPNKRGEKYQNGVSDDKPQDEYRSFLLAFTRLALSVADFVLVNIQSVSGNKIALAEYAYDLRHHLADVAVWVKDNPQPAMEPRVMNSAFEFIWCFSCKEYPTRHVGNNEFRGTVSNVLSGPSQGGKNEYSDIHAATFPLYLPSWAIGSFLAPSGSVYDPFLGSGTTLIAAHRLGRKAYGCELEPKYADVILRRAEAEGLDVRKEG